MTPARWNHTTTCKFVELYREHECLWNMNSGIYRNKQARETALGKIAEDIAIDGFNVEEAKQKIKSLRATYQQEQNKIIKSEKSGAGSDDVYKPTMKWFSAMQAIMKSGQLQRTTISNLNDIDTNVCKEKDIQQLEEDQPITDISANISVEQKTTVHSGSTQKNKKARNKLTEVNAAIQELKALNQSVNRVEEEDACYVFGKHLAMQLKQPSEEQCIIAQDEIQRVLTRCRLHDLRSKSRRLSANSSQNSFSLHQYSNHPSVHAYSIPTPMPSPVSIDTSQDISSHIYPRSVTDPSPTQDILSEAVSSLSQEYYISQE